MAMRAAAHFVRVQPSGDNNETSRGRLTIVQNAPENNTIYRGVVLHVGHHIPERDDGLDVGCVLHYTGYWTLNGEHMVPAASIIGFEVDE